jgi:hypothetical protein
MEISRQRVKTFSAVAAVGYAMVLGNQVDDFSVSDPKPVLHAALAQAGGTLIVGEGGFHSGPPNEQVDVKVRRMIGGAALPDS